MKVQTLDLEVEYPETDGRPMGETDLHREWMIRIIDLLKYRYRGQRVYVSGNLIMYYEDGDPSHFVVPDAMVVKDCDPARRRIFKIWEEQRVPSVIFETTSRSTKREDMSYKAQLYQSLGIPEYFLYDPTADYLRPPLQGWRLVGAGYQPIGPDAQGRLACQQLALWLSLDGRDLVLHDSQTGQQLRTETEDQRDAYERERDARQHDRAAYEAELDELRQKLKERGQAE